MKDKPHVYGPVPSRRLGMSLGVDLLPEKICCYDCTYCQVGKTTKLTTKREIFFPPDEVVREVEAALATGPRPQIISLAGSGEPTLYAALNELVDGLRRITDLPLALITNSGLLWDDDVAKAALRFDLAAPSLDAADEQTWRELNKPAAQLSFAQMWQGLSRFCHAYRGELRLEVMLVEGVNNSPPKLRELSRLASSLPTSSVDLNTVVRPPMAKVRALSEAQMLAALGIFSSCPQAKAQIISSFAAEAQTATAQSLSSQAKQQIITTVARRPCTSADLAAATHAPLEAVQQFCEQAVKDGLLIPEGEFFKGTV